MTTMQNEHEISVPESPSKHIAVRRILDCCDGSLGRDYLRFLSGRSDADSQSSRDELTVELIDLSAKESVESSSCREANHTSSMSEIVLFLGDDDSAKVMRAFRWIVIEARSRRLKCVVVIPGLSRHFQSSRAIDTESTLHDDLKPHLSSLVIIRTGFVLSPSSATSRWVKRLSGLQPLLLPRMTTTFLAGAKLFSAINEELKWEQGSSGSSISLSGSGTRELSIPGQRRSWHSVLEPLQTNGRRQQLFNILAVGLSRIGIPWLLFWLVVLLGRLSPALRQLHFHTFKPRSVRELISLCNRHNCDDIQIAGYNNGVNHFGWKYPHRIVVLTTLVPGKLRLVEDSIAEGRVTVDAGLTLNDCIRKLARAQREFLVVPNYSWISMGTLFFVPVHGSGSRVSTLGDTIDEVLLYDGINEHFVKARRGDAIFREAMYNRNRHWLLLRLTLKVKVKSRCFVRQSTIDHATADDIQKLFQDPEASNVEIRKHKAASNAIHVSHYDIDTGERRGGSLEVPRDSIGRVWDRLEETPVISTLFHWFVRTFAFHVELFLKPEEFEIFWKLHQTLPVSKIQLRRVLKDGMTHSACENHDCISADLFTTRRNRDVFSQFIATHLPNVRTNPGKQSF